MVIVDTSVWIDFLNQKPTPATLWLRSGHDGEVLGLTSNVLTEILQGIRLDSRFRQVEKHFRSFHVFGTVSFELARQSADNFRTLRSRGITIRSTVDCLLATFCIAGGYRLLHQDSDFDHFERHLGLTVLHP